MSHSEAVKASWANPETAEKRAQRTKVAVKDHGEFKSVRAAFDDLGLPIKKHGKFRMELKEKGEHAIEHEGVNYVFSVVADQ